MIFRFKPSDCQVGEGILPEYMGKLNPPDSFTGHINIAHYTLPAPTFREAHSEAEGSDFMIADALLRTTRLTFYPHYLERIDPLTHNRQRIRSHYVRVM